MPDEARRRLLQQMNPARPEVEAAVERMKSLSLEARRAAETHIRAESPDFRPNETLRQEYEPMRWEELQALSAEVITIGSHTCSHPILPHLNDEDMKREVVQSREELERRLERKVEHFSYPNGDKAPRVVECVRATYRSAVTVQPGFVRRGEDPHLIPRIPTPRSLAALAWRLCRPGG